ncbi:MAG: ATP-binding cassette domain-containing protein [Thermomicrobium sp.]|nr:ATP-binding cassette domain-containing protein [Thermomicrobium sp.]
MAQAVQLPRQLLDRKPSGLSGGLRQRVVIAHGLAGNPRLLVLDEPTSALDVSTQAAIVELLLALQRRTGMSMLFISHDLPLVSYLADRLAVLYAGWVVEFGPTERLLRGPVHPYTATLIASAEPTAVDLPATADQPMTLTVGCPYAPRCPFRILDVCDRSMPPLQRLDAEHLVRCHLPRAQLPVARIAQTTSVQRPPGKAARE